MATNKPNSSMGLTASVYLVPVKNIFFTIPLKSRPSAPDPPSQGKFSLQKNRRSSWHLAPDIRSLPDPEFDSEPEPDNEEEEDLFSEAKQQRGYTYEDSTELPDGIVGEIIRAARNLPENSTLGEFMGGYQGKLSEKECLEVLSLMGKQGLALGCLYFFEWMRLQEPSLVTPRACSIIFPVLGRWGMGDKLMVLFRNLPQSKGFRDVHVYNAAISGLLCSKSRRMQPEIVEKLLVEMQDMGLNPDVKSYTCLISAYGRQKKMSDRAADAFLRMKKVGLKPTSHSYTSLIHAYSISGWHEKAYTAFEDMQREGLKPSIETYTALLDAFRRAGDTQRLMKVWKLMMSEKIKGTCVTFNILLDGFAKQGQYIEARDVISEFGKIGLQPTVMTYNMLMNAYARGGQHLKLPQLLKQMMVLDLKPDSVTYSTMIYAFVRVRDFKRAFYYHKQMVKNGQVPDVKSYEKLRSILDVKAAKQNKRDKSAILGIINSKMGMVKAKRKTKKDEVWKYKKRNHRTPDVAHDGQK
ncbi:hypothetical protein GOBAR_DD20814 [Gossypium barbadense]|nr:hypothetical protein GOBAR_DD20814 [Gossypium barbadense]